MLGGYNVAEVPFPFNYKNFGTFAGPQYLTGSYDYDKAATEGIWHTLANFDTSFKNLDLGAYLFNNEADYVGFHCDYVSTAMMTLEASYGNIPIFNVFANQVNVNGNIRAIGDITAIGNLSCNGLFTFNGSMSLTGIGDVATKVKANTTLANSKKSFDIPHPTKKEHRLRYICVETPKADVYVRGKLKGSNTINLPEYWKELVDPDSIDVILTPIGSFQELFVENIHWGTKVVVKNSAGGPINCSYVVYAERRDTESNIPEYKGLTEADYPGDNSAYNINSD
jgi:hypothetical protein